MKFIIIVMVSAFDVIRCNVIQRATFSLIISLSIRATQCDVKMESCVVCDVKDSKKNPLVKTENSRNDLFDVCKNLNKIGDTVVSQTWRRLSDAKQGNYLENIRYHAQCRKTIVKRNKRKTSEEPDDLDKTPNKRVGRPAKVTPPARVQREIAAPKERKCFFQDANSASHHLHFKT